MHCNRIRHEVFQNIREQHFYMIKDASCWPAWELISDQSWASGVWREDCLLQIHEGGETARICHSSGHWPWRQVKWRDVFFLVTCLYLVLIPVQLRVKSWYQQSLGVLSPQRSLGELLRQRQLLYQIVSSNNREFIKQWQRGY